jgi:hypothetical protein
MTAAIVERAEVFAAAVLVGCLVSVIDAAGLVFAVPDGWKTRQPQSSMRVAEFTLPRAAGDTEDAELVLYYFGGEGGSVQANIDRWLSQIQQPDGKPSKAVAHEEQRTVNGLNLTLLDVSGRYVADAMPGNGQRVDKPDFRLRAGVIQTPKGPYFLKLTGPRKTVAKWDRAFQQFIDSLKYQA